MSTIKRDKVGLFINIEGSIVRPITETRFILGDRPQTHHFKGGPFHGVGKDKTKAIGLYQEVWLGCGDIHTHKTTEKKMAEFRAYKIEYGKECLRRNEVIKRKAGAVCNFILGTPPKPS